MAKLSILIYSLLTLGFLGASSASAAVAVTTMVMAAAANNTRINQEKSKDTKEDTSSRISCVPQQSSNYLWTCSDAYGNQFENLIISKEKHGNSKSARN